MIEVANKHDILGPFTIRTSGNVGQEIMDPNGKIIAWTTDGWIAQVIAKLLNENEGLLGVAPQTVRQRKSDFSKKGKEKEMNPLTIVQEEEDVFAECASLISQGTLELSHAIKCKDWKMVRTAYHHIRQAEFDLDHQLGLSHCYADELPKDDICPDPDCQCNHELEEKRSW